MVGADICDGFRIRRSRGRTAGADAGRTSARSARHPADAKRLAAIAGDVGDIHCEANNTRNRHLSSAWPASLPARWAASTCAPQSSRSGSASTTRAHFRPSASPAQLANPSPGDRGGHRELFQRSTGEDRLVAVDVQQITGTSRSVRQLLSESRYGLDFYQREYSWEAPKLANSSTT